MSNILKDAWILILMLFIFNSSYSQKKYDDKEIGFDREKTRKELLQNNAFIKKEFIEQYLDKLREDLISRHELGFSKWLEKKTKGTVDGKKDRLSLERFVDCESFTFSGENPFSGWTLSNNIDIFLFGDPYTEQVENNILGDRHLNDIGGFRFLADQSSYTDPFFGTVRSSVARIGNSGTGQRKEMISRSFILQNITDFIVYDFAIALQDPGHDGRPFYNISLLRNGALIPCSVVTYEAKSNIEGFELVENTRDIYVKPWATNVIKPHDFGVNVGDEVEIRVSVSDCNAGGHFGYGLFDIQCLDESQLINLSQEPCFGEPITFSTILDTNSTRYKWSVYDRNNNLLAESNNNSQTLTHTFDRLGNYTVKLEVDYFTTTEGCSTVSTFTRVIQIRDCEPCIDCTSFDLLKNEKYLVSAWVKEEDLQKPNTQYKNYDSALVRISFKDVNRDLIGTEAEFKPSGEIIDGWQRIIGEFVVPDNVDDMFLELVNNDTAKTIYFDDVRVLPTKGNMKSFVYDQETHRLMAELDENNYSTFYEYDLEGGLVRIKKETEKGVFTIQETRSGNKKTSPSDD